MIYIYLCIYLQQTNNNIMKVTTTISIDHKVKELGQKKAKKEKTNLSAYIEQLIINDNQ